jgi:hypothetical protein
MGKSLVLSASAIIAALITTNAFAADTAYEPPMDLLASQIRDQGFVCNKPESAKLEEGQSKPNETVWVLKCESDSYRMTVVPDLAAKIEKLGK